MIKNYLLLLLILILLVNSTFAEKTNKEYDNPAILSFETIALNISRDGKSSLSISRDHFKHLKKSLKWSWNAPNAQWEIKQNVGYIPLKKKSDAFVSTFVFWVYSEKPLKNEKLKVEFLKENQVKCYFDYNLDFSGWRGAWIAFNRDMQGTPVEGMDEVRFTAPDTPEGTLYFDHMMLSSMQDVRQHTADFQAPFINKNTENHWLILLRSWNKDFDIPLNSSFSISEKEGTEIISNRLRNLLLEGKKIKSVEDLRKSFDQYQISLNQDGSVKGLPVFFERYGETYEYLGAERYNKIFDNPMGLSSAVKTLFDLAVSYNLSTDEKEKKQFSEMFILLTKHLLDQGFQAGSGMGTLHHLGYSMRDYYPAMFLMAKPLKENKLDKTIQQSMEWFAGTGEVKTDTKDVEMDIDAFNTSLIGRLTSILMIDDVASKIRYLHAFSRWVDQGFKYSNGTRGSFKADGSIFHHRHNYPAYAVGGLTGAVQSVYLLNKTNFKISQESHEILKKALLSMRIYCNLRTWPLSLSGRHPDGKGQLNPEHYALLALAGSPDTKQVVDSELAAAYLRLIPKETIRSKDLKKAGFIAENSPNGNWSFPYSCLNIHRRDNWMVSAMGHSRYLWSTEIYRGENMYGRYINHGSIQILATGTPVSNEGSGFRQEGWDWNHFPGTTATVLPLKELRAKIKNLDQFSGFEEMLLSDEAFAGGISLDNKQGAFAMKLHEHDKYNGSLRARKSVFFFDNRAVALGSDIQSALPLPTQTTLFQTYIDQINKPYYLNGKNITEFPYAETVRKEKTIISDGQNNYFFVNNGEVLFSKTVQQSFDEETDAPTSNDYALASINHGGNLRNGRYEYMILIQPSEKDLQLHLKAKEPSYIVHQSDSSAHIVFDKQTKTSGYVFFAPSTTANLLVKKVNTPCLIMTDESIANKLTIAVSDPDLRFYDGKPDDNYDNNGKRLERSVYSRSWKDNPSKTSEIKVTLNGFWETEKNYDFIKTETLNDTTVLTVNCYSNRQDNSIKLIKTGSN